MYESAPWRTELRKFSVIIRDSQSWPSDEVPFELERAVFYSAVVLRKLIEDRKLTDSFITEKQRTVIHKAIPPNKSSILRNLPGSVEFERQDEQFLDISIYELCSQIVHFLARNWVFKDDKLTGMIVCSYRKQDNCGYHISFDKWAALLEKAAVNRPTQMRLGQNGERKIE